MKMLYVLAVEIYCYVLCSKKEKFSMLIMRLRKKCINMMRDNNPIQHSMVRYIGGGSLTNFTTDGIVSV